jgi:carbon monoxide dehydrogenase subunit G
MARIEQSIKVNCTPEQAFTLATDFNKAASWQTGVIEAKVTSEGEPGVGTTYAWTAKALGQTMETRGEVTVWNPPSAYEWKATKSPFPMAGGMKFQADESGTLVTVFADAEPGGFFKLAEGMIKSQMEKQFEGNLEALKKALEE